MRGWGALAFLASARVFFPLCLKVASCGSQMRSWRHACRYHGEFSVATNLGVGWRRARFRRQPELELGRQKPRRRRERKRRTILSIRVGPAGTRLKRRGAGRLKRGQILGRKLDGIKASNLGHQRPNRSSYPSLPYPAKAFDVQSSHHFTAGAICQPKSPEGSLAVLKFAPCHGQSDPTHAKPAKGSLSMFKFGTAPQ